MFKIVIGMNVLSFKYDNAFLAFLTQVAKQLSGGEVSGKVPGGVADSKTGVARPLAGGVASGVAGRVAAMVTRPLVGGVASGVAGRVAGGVPVRFPGSGGFILMI